MAIPPISPQVIAGAKAIVTVLGPSVLEETRKYWSKDHGSKVKRGAFQECSIEMFGDKACIVVDESNGNIVMLTSDTIQSYQFVKKKKRIVGLSSHTYYYYDIIYKDGRESYIRMRKQYQDAMLNHM